MQFQRFNFLKSTSQYQFHHCNPASDSNIQHSFQNKKAQSRNFPKTNGVACILRRLICG